MKSKTRTTLQIIFTFTKGEQLIGNFEFNPRHIETKEAFVEFSENAVKAIHAFLPCIKHWGENQSENEEHCVPNIPDLVKLSACIIQFDGEEIETPKWWDDAGGKVYFES